MGRHWSRAFHPPWLLMCFCKKKKNHHVLFMKYCAVPFNEWCLPGDFLSLTRIKMLHRSSIPLYLFVYRWMNIHLLKQQQMKPTVLFFKKNHVLFMKFIKTKLPSVCKVTVNVFTCIKRYSSHTPFRSSQQISVVVWLTRSLTPWSGTGRVQILCYKPHLQSRKTFKKICSG